MTGVLVRRGDTHICTHTQRGPCEDRDRTGATQLQPKNVKDLRSHRNLGRKEASFLEAAEGAQPLISDF